MAVTKRCADCGRVVSAARVERCQACETRRRKLEQLARYEKRCPSCGETKPFAEFYQNHARFDGLSVLCRPCHTRTTSEDAQRLRAQALDKYGGVCGRCGFSDQRALQIDHVDGGGRQERVTVASPSVFYRKVLADTTGAYQLLCANCNVIKKLERGKHGGRRT